MNHWKECLLEFLFPPRCAICGNLLPLEEEERRLCADCKKEIPFLLGETCQLCGRKVTQDMLCTRCRLADYPFAAGIAAFSYETMRRAIAEFKFHGYRRDAKQLGSLMAEYLKRYHTDWIRWTDLLTEVPLHPKKQRRRGFNQVDLLCREIAERTELVYVPDTLARRVDTLPQSTLSEEKRRDNLRDVFLAVKEQEIAGKRILLIDDIFTTGATLRECTRALLRAGAAEVRVYCLSVVSHETEEIKEIHRKMEGK